MGATAAASPPAEDAVRLLLRYLAASALPQVQVPKFSTRMATTARPDRTGTV